MTVVYYIALIVICLMIYDLAYNRKEGFQHRGQEIIPTSATKEDDMDGATTIVGNAFWASYTISETLAKLIILVPFNIVRSIVKLLTSGMDYLLDLIQVVADMFYSLIRPAFNAAMAVFIKLVDLFKATMKNIRNLPAIMKDFFEVQIEMISSGFDMFVSTMETLMNAAGSIASSVADIPKGLFGLANQSMELGLAMFTKGMVIPEKMIGIAIDMTNKI